MTISRRASLVFAVLSLLFIVPTASAQQNPPSDKKSASDLIALARSRSSDLANAIRASFDPKQLAAGTAWLGHGHDFFFATEASGAPQVFIDGRRGPDLTLAVPGLWFAVARIEGLGNNHSFYYMVSGSKFGGSLDVPAFGPESYLKAGVPSGTLSEKIAHTSKIYDGMKADYWIYVPAQYKSDTPAALMVFQDGGGYIHRDGNNPALNVIDNLIAEKKIPVMICVFINPGDISESAGTPTYNFVKSYSDKSQRSLKDSMRSVLYDTVSDRYVRYLRDEILAEVGAKYNIRKDSYSRAITGLSSGGICAFNAAWQMPEQFSRVISWIGSFESIQWKEDPAIPDGGQDYPNKVRREPKRNIRVWLQDGANDIDALFGDWPLANLRMATALKFKEYDFHLSFGEGTHNSAHGAAEFPEEMMWLWRDYDPAKTSQEFAIDPAEKSKPTFRVAIVNR